MSLRSLVITMLFAARSLTPATTFAQDTTGVGAVAGVVVDENGNPAAGAAVCLVVPGRCAVTGADGRFRITDVRPGRWALEVVPPSGAALTGATVEVRAGLDSSVQVVLPRAVAFSETVTVTAPAFLPPEEIKTSGFLIQPAEILNSAGALQDVSRYVQALPGVVFGANDFRNDLIVRGGSPLENLFVVDNVEIPNINAFANFSSAGGTVGLLDAALVQDVTFLTGGFPAPYGNRASSVLQVTQREGDRGEFQGRATLGFAGTGLIGEGPLAGGKGSWVASVRRSFLDLFTDDIGIGGVPVAYTANVKAVIDPGPNDRVWVVNVSGVDRIRLGLTDDTDLDEPLADFDIRYRGWRAATGVNWQRVLNDRTVGLLGVSHSEARLTSTVKDLVRDGVPPASVPADDVIAAGPVVFRETSREGETTAKYDLTTTVLGQTRFRLGGSLKAFGLDYDTSAPLGTDSPFSVEAGINPFALERRFTTWTAGGYVQATRDLTSRLNLTGGFRVDHFGFLNQTRFSPRAGVSYRLTDALSWRAAFGQYHQQPPFLFLAAFPGNADLEPLRADHYVTGVTWLPAPELRLTAEVYRKVYSDYPVSSQFPSLSLANVGDTFNVREVLFPLVSGGRGVAYGVELLAEKKPGGRWYGQANLALSRTRHAGLDGVLRPGSYDYPIVANVDGGWTISPRWRFTTRLAWLGGRPYTPFDDAASSTLRRGIYDLDAVNARRAPDYLRIDARVERRFGSADTPFVIYAGVQNLTNRRNFAGYNWNRRLNAPQFQEQMGIFPILGLDYRF